MSACLSLVLALVATAPAKAPAPAAAKAEPAKAASAASSWPGPKSATATAERGEVRLGEPFTVTLEVRHIPGEKWTLKSGQALDPFKLRAQTSTDVTSGDAQVTRLALELSLFALGPHAVPDLTLLAESPGAPAHEFVLPGPLVKGVAAPGGDKEKRDIRGPVPLTVTTFRPLLYALAALVLAAAVVYGVRRFRRRQRTHTEPVAPPVPSDERALDGLRTLEGEGLPASGRFKEFHLRLSDLLRRYLAERYEIHALDMTSEELYRAMSRVPSEGLNLTDLAWVCAQGDLAKFAKGAPTVEDCRQALQFVRQIVLRTRRRVFDANGVAGRDPSQSPRDQDVVV